MSADQSARDAAACQGMSHSSPPSPTASTYPFTIAGSVFADWWHQARQGAIAAAVPVPELDWLVLGLTDLPRLTVRLGTFAEVAQIGLRIPWAELQQRWQRRLTARVPVQYLVGRVAWREFELQVSPAVLIPRPETECVIDLAVQARQNAPCAAEAVEQWADLGTGSGAIALGLATAWPNVQVQAVEQSAAAIAIAQANVAAAGLGDRVTVRAGDWFGPLSHLVGQLTGMVANPPYIPSALVPQLQPEVSQHEPHAALDGGADGLDCVRHLVTAAPPYLRSGGIWLVELMAGQAATVKTLLRQQGHYRDITSHPDLAGIERFVLAYRR